jgi:hypothetical protein
MRLTKTAFGRGKSVCLSKGVGSLSLKALDANEARGLLVATTELEQNFGFWCPIMFAAQEDLLSKNDIAVLEGIVKRAKKRFDKYVGGE